ncbi:MAG: DoxX family membrane protein, partial [Hymenobacteraceae bacterium]|nr:DoxX family membrane protein [Hymenobacteraceae bacterium]
MRLYDIYLLLIRLFLGYVFASAGLCKLTAGQFGQLIGPPTADMLPGLEGIWQFLAASQVLVGALVLSGRWSLAGLLALL